MLEMRPNCECCNANLLPEDAAFICSFECTYCAHCTQNKLGSLCPNCGGELVARPSRAIAQLTEHPASTLRVFNPNGCP